MLDVLQRFRGGTQAAPTICECRRCGATLTPLETEGERCEYCGPTTVVCYQFD